jgi:hypothetical protein
MDVRFEQLVNIKFYVKVGKTATFPLLPWSLSVRFFLFPRLKKRLKWQRHENMEAKRLRRWISQASRKRHSPAAFRTCRNAGNSVLTAEGNTSKGTGLISCEVEFCTFYRLSLRTLRTKDVIYLLQLYYTDTITVHIKLRISLFCFIADILHSPRPSFWDII